MRLLIPLVLSSAVLLAACSDEDNPPLALPQSPPGAVLLEGERVETPIDTILLSVRQASDAQVSWGPLYDVTDTGPDVVIEHYDETLTAQGWKRVGGDDTLIDGALGATWERDGQHVVVSLVTVNGVDVALLLSPTT